jgi:hypothetical protein
LWDYNDYPGYNPRAGYVRAEGLEISYNFLPGHTYFLRPIFTVTNVTKKEVEIEIYAGSSSIPSLTTNKRVRLIIDENKKVVTDGTVATIE